MLEDRFMRRQEVEAMLGLSRSTLYRLMSDGNFVRPHRIGKRAVRWRLSEVLDFIDTIKDRLYTSIFDVQTKYRTKRYEIVR